MGKRQKRCRDCRKLVNKHASYCPDCGFCFITRQPGLQIDGFKKGIPHKDNRFTQKIQEDYERKDSQATKETSSETK